VRVYLSDPGELDRVLVVGTNRAREVAEATLASVYDKVGLLGR
jgi:tryptophanyl-tRNA synthetase